MPDPAALLRHVVPPTPDADLLRRFVADRDPDAFAELVRRHGPVVYRVCRRLLGPTAADDAFQATFLVLVTRPDSVRKAGSVGSWLVGVAGRVARQMRKRERLFQASGRRQSAEFELPTRPTDVGRSPEWAEQFRVLDEELTRLPDRLRGPVVVCLLEGRTQEQAVAELGGSARTIRRRLDEAKRLLRLRLERRGVVPAVAAGLAASVGEATATVPADLPARTAATVFDFLAGGAAASAPAAVIAKGVAMGTLARKVKLLMVSAAVGLTALGVGLAGDDPKPADQPGPAAPPAVRAAPPAPALAEPFLSAVGRAIDREFIYQRDRLGKLWLGGDDGQPDRRWGLNIWVMRPGEAVPPQLNYFVEVVYHRGTDRNEASAEFGYGGGRWTRARIDLSGPLEDVLENQLPGQVARLILAGHLGKPPAKWAADAAALTAESPEKQAGYDRACRAMLEQGEAVRLSVLFKMTEYPRGPNLAAQGHSVVRFLLGRKAKAAPPVLSQVPYVSRLFPYDGPPHTRFLNFVLVGMESGWDRAAELYGFDNVEALEQAWVGWMKTSESRLAKGEDPPRPKAAAPNDPASPHIPPVKLSGVEPERVGRIVIEGNTVTPDRVILKQISLVPGQVLEYPKLEEARKNLIRLGVFDPDDPPTVEVVPGDADGGFRDIRVRVKEAPRKGGR